VQHLAATHKGESSAGCTRCPPILSDATRYQQVKAAKQDITRKALPPAPLRPGSQAPVASYNSSKIAEVSRQLNNATGMQAVRLPVAIQEIVVRREAERDGALQRALQKIADEKKQLKAAAENVRENEPKPENKTEEKTNVENETASAGA
jgi:hypothetical protein